MLISTAAGISKIIQLLTQLRVVTETVLYTKPDKYNYFLEMFHNADREVLHVEIIRLKIFRKQNEGKKPIRICSEFPNIFNLCSKCSTMVFFL